MLQGYPEELTTTSKKTGVPVITRMIQGNFVCVFVLVGWIRLVILHNSEVTTVAACMDGSPRAGRPLAAAVAW